MSLEHVCDMCGNPVEEAAYEGGRVSDPICAQDECRKPRDRGHRYCGMHRSRIRRHGSPTPRHGSHGTIAERYERFVVRSDDGCWSWTGARNNHGYSRLGRDYGHRVSWELHNGPIAEGLLVLHHCDNPICTRPEHLFLGSQTDNMADAAAKGRLDGRPQSGRRSA